MHSRVGLDTVYLSNEWFQLTQACIDEAVELDMVPWLYDRIAGLRERRDDW